MTKDPHSRAEDHFSGAEKADDPPDGSGRTAVRSTERLVITCMAVTGPADHSAMVSLTVTVQTDSSATFSLTVTGQTESPGVGTTDHRGAEADTAASKSSAAEAATPGGSGADFWTGKSSGVNS